MHGTTLPTGPAARACAALAAGSLLVTGCSSTAGSKDPTAALRSQLPAPVKSAGVLKIASDLTYAPVDYKDANGTPLGLDPDLALELGKVLGVKVQIVDTPFDKLIPGLQEKKFDAVMSALTDSRQRRDGTDENGKVINPGVDFVDYFIAGTSILVGKGNPKGIKTLDDFCGHTVALQRGTTQAEIVNHQVTACERSGKPLTVHYSDSDDLARAEVAAGRAVADLNDFPVAVYAAKNDAKFEVAGAQQQPEPYGIGVAKGNQQLRDALAKAVDQVIRNGSYDTVLTKWGLTAGAAQNAVVNGGD
ncbi:ABC transporter substrate-binding protein [Kitasatospora sp. NPDC002227]|uniref:ABC transporter substrate-binding protein n=1 Tax=Kitasatospora sp. NPDC002227 TaxID=3154773 RepID=UPI00332A5677